MAVGMVQGLVDRVDVEAGTAFGVADAAERWEPDIAVAGGVGWDQDSLADNKRWVADMQMPY